LRKVTINHQGTGLTIFSEQQRRSQNESGFWNAPTPTDTGRAKKEQQYYDHHCYRCLGLIMLLLRDCGGRLLFVYEWRLHFQSAASILRASPFPELIFEIFSFTGFGIVEAALPPSTISTLMPFSVKIVLDSHVFHLCENPGAYLLNSLSRK
jgi:hypothetical protein